MKAATDENVTNEESREESRASAHGRAHYTSTRRPRKALGLVALAALSCGGDDHAPPAPSAAASLSSEASVAAAAPAPSSSAPPPPVQAWRSLGFGAAEKERAEGDVAFVGLSGWKITLEPTESWIDALDRETLKAHGVRWRYAVQGPKDVFYKARELDVLAVARSIAAHHPKRVVVAAHSSGAYVAHALLEVLEPGPYVVYFNLDGGDEGLTPKARERADEFVFVAATDPAVRTSTPHRKEMKKAAAHFKATFLDVEAPDSGCRKGATWCMHMTLITTRPHDAKKAGGEIDYTDWQGIRPTTAWLEKAF